MAKRFNTTGACNPAKHYMVDLSSRLEVIKRMVDDGDYFTINRARQYGKTTILRALAAFLKDDYEVIFLDFQRLGSASYENESSFTEAFSSMLIRAVDNFPDGIRERIVSFAEENEKKASLQKLFQIFEDWCALSRKPIVLLIDEVDSATNNQIFLDFLAQLRAAYLDRDVAPAFQSVILTGVHDVRNMKRKIRPDEEGKVNSPWNIAAKFNLSMDFSVDEIQCMIQRYEEEYCTGMNIDEIADLIYAYTSGYPVLVSYLCKLMDEELEGTKNFLTKNDAWTANGLTEAVKRLLREPMPLFESMVKQIQQYPELKQMLINILFEGANLTFNPYNEALNLGMMFGYIRPIENQVAISNRIFEMLLYDYFLSEEEMNSSTYKSAQGSKNQFIRNGKLDMDSLLEKFVMHFEDVYADNDQKFVEKYGRKIFLMYLKPIINGTGNYYIEAETRDQKRTDVVVDYLGKQYIIELKINRGPQYHEEGERQLSDYLDRYHQKKGYMLIFDFNQKKETGVRQVFYQDKVLMEATV